MDQLLRNLAWIEEMLPAEVIPKKMLGGIGYYLDEKLILILVESSRTREHKGILYPFEIWNGCFFPIEKIKQNKVWSLYPNLENHPVKKNCLYLPADAQDIEEYIKLLLREIKKRNPLFGIMIKLKSQQGEFKIDSEAMDTSKPILFNTGTIPKKTVSSKKKITEKPNKKVKADKKGENNLMLSILKKTRS